jgi:serine/threonine protein kinase
LQPCASPGAIQETTRRQLRILYLLLDARECNVERFYINERAFNFMCVRRADHELGVMHRDLKPENFLLTHKNADLCAPLAAVP